MNIKNDGFTLIELMIVVAIVGIIAAVDYPSYTTQMQKTRRSDAMAMLTSAAANQERILVKSGTYTSAESQLNASGAVSENGFYSFHAVLPTETAAQRTVTYTSPTSATATVTLSCPGARCFVLAAVAQGGQANDTQCAILTLDSTSRTRSYDKDGNANAIGTCWK